MKKMKRGLLISVEGIDGSGKSTLVRNITHKLHALEYPVVATREPGATALGAIIRGIVQKNEVPRIPKAEYLLFAADRAQHFHEIVLPALEQGMIVVSDRMTDSSLVYQGYVRGLDQTMIASINSWTMNTRSIDRTIYVKIDAHTALDRLRARAQELSVFEGKLSFTQKLVTGFDTLFANNPRIETVDGNLGPEALADETLQRILTWMQTNNLMV